VRVFVCLCVLIQIKYSSAGYFSPFSINCGKATSASGNDTADKTRIVL
jgi:hypothetical protein